MQTSTVKPRANRLTPAPQGVGGFDECWYPVALSAEVLPGKIHGTEFLDGRIIVVRSMTGDVSALSAYCRHLGADIADGDVADDCVRCPFHHWKYDLAGYCLGSDVGDPSPNDASLFAFPTKEAWGLIWAFNGLEPTYDVPSWDEPDEARYYSAILAMDYRGDPFLAALNVLDVAHLRSVHDLAVNDIELFAEGSTFHVDMRIGSASKGLPELTRHAHLIGTNAVVYSNTSIGIDALSAATPYGHGRSRLYMVTAALRSAFSPTEIADKVAQRERISQVALAEDLPILDHIRFRADRLTKSDRSIATFLQFVQSYPRSHHSSDHIT
jgi:nitrite reductase/ring-hydroxylating ferredoxin subunit